MNSLRQCGRASNRILAAKLREQVIRPTNSNPIYGNDRGQCCASWRHVRGYFNDMRPFGAAKTHKYITL
jgi:hypothetical protein